MSAACGCDEPTTSPADEAEETERPWWRDPGLVVPILSGVAFGTGLALEWSGLHIAAQQPGTEQARSMHGALSSTARVTSTSAVSAAARCGSAIS